MKSNVPTILSEIVFLLLTLVGVGFPSTLKAQCLTQYENKLTPEGLKAREAALPHTFWIRGLAVVGPTAIGAFAGPWGAAGGAAVGLVINGKIASYENSKRLVAGKIYLDDVALFALFNYVENGGRESTRVKVRNTRDGSSQTKLMGEIRFGLLHESNSILYALSAEELATNLEELTKIDTSICHQYPLASWDQVVQKVTAYTAKKNQSSQQQIQQNPSTAVGSVR